jgi:cellulose synthase/poly-beta-1,6-N-acetylglucosamine synthase-like glycosyltransferase
MTHSPDHGRPSDGSGLSIVVPEARRLPGTLPHLIAYAAALAERAEVIVIDNGSDAGTGEIAAALGDDHRTNVRLIRDSGGMLLDRGPVRLNAWTGRYRLERPRSPAPPGPTP